MPRYFIEVSYRGTQYSGFQIQENSNTIQAEVEKAFNILHRRPVVLTGSSRTDAGVHALQNYFHFDDIEAVHPHFIYKMNAIMPDDIVIRQFHSMPEAAHSRFDALSREYEYRIYTNKDPFLKGLALYYPYKLDQVALKEAADIVCEETNFFSFAKTNTQVKNFNCAIVKSRWIIGKDHLIYNIEGNRFLRGMVRLLTASMLAVGRGRISVEMFGDLFRGDEKCGYSVAPTGLYLKAVKYPENYFPPTSTPFTAF
jgi:tRNA pseudouridine38-40 synthase